MAAMLARHQLDDGTRLAMSFDTQHNAVIGPLHAASLLLRKFQAHAPVALGIVAPAFTYLHEQEKMHRLLRYSRDLFPCFRADGLDRGTAFAEHDLALAFPLHIDRLLDPHRAVPQLLPAVGLDRGLIGQF